MFLSGNPRRNEPIIAVMRYFDTNSYVLYNVLSGNPRYKAPTIPGNIYNCAPSGIPRQYYLNMNKNDAFGTNNGNFALIRLVIPDRLKPIIELILM